MSSAGGRPSDRDLTTAVTQMAGLTAAGLPLATGLRAMASEASSRSLRRTLLLICEHLERGESLETIFATMPHIPPSLLNLIQAGEKTGRLDLFLQDYLEHTREEQRLHSRILWTMLYPIALLVVTMGLFTFWIAGFVDEVLKTFNYDFMRSGVSAPSTITFTSLLYWLLSRVLDFRWLIAVILIGIVVLAVGACIPRFRARILWFVGKCVPPIRDVLNHRATAGFCNLSADLVEQRLSLADSLRIAGGSSTSTELTASADYLAAMSLAGGDLGNLAIYEKPIPLDVAHAFRWHTDGRMFVQTLRDCASNHSQQIESNWGFTLLEQLLRPAIIVMIGAFVFWAYAAMLVPLFKLLNDLS